MTEQHIEGVASWLKVVAIRVPKIGERYLLQDLLDEGTGTKCATHDWLYSKAIIVAPNNAYNRCDLDTMPLPEGERRISDKEEEWFRQVKVGDRFLTFSGSVGTSTHDWERNTKRIILAPRKKRVLVVEAECGDRQFESSYDAASCLFWNVASADIKYRVETR